MGSIAALYARVSTLQQEQEATIESQVAAIGLLPRATATGCSRSSISLTRPSAAAQLARPALDRLRDLAAEGLFEVVLCLSPDRLARQYVHQWVLLEELRQAGVTVVFVNQPAVADDAQSQAPVGYSRAICRI